MNKLTERWNNVHATYKIVAAIFFAGSTYAGYVNLQEEVKELKDNRIEIIELKIQTAVLSEKVVAIQEKLKKMDDKLDKIVKSTE